MKTLNLLLFFLIPILAICQYDNKYYIQSNYVFKYYEEGEYDKSIQSFELIPDSLLRHKDFIILLNIYLNRDDTSNFKTTIAKFAKMNNSCEEIYNTKSLNKYKHFIKEKCNNAFDSIYKEKYASIEHFISFLNTSIQYSHKYRTEKIFDSVKIASVDKNAYLFLTNIKLKEVASALKYITQKDNSVYLNLHATLIHLNYYDSTSSIVVENWAKELMNYGLLEPKDYAYIIDRRICLKGDSKQKYGTHFWNYNANEVIEINKNREKIGLLPIN
jgi:hypothetical protein